MWRTLFLCILLAWLPAAHAQPLPDAISAALADSGIPAEALGVVVLRGDKVLLAHGEQRSMNPASTMKLLTTMAALERLGPVFRGRTELRTAAPVVYGKLEGDLILRGGADADFTGEVLTAMLQSLRNNGIRAIKGRLIVDRTLFQPARPDLGAAPFDQAPEFRYNVIPDALLLNTNLLRIELRTTDDRLQLIMLPEMDRISIRHDMKLIDADCSKWEAGWKIPTTAHGIGDRIKVILHGTFPRNCTQILALNILDRQDYVERLVRTTWRKLGGSWTFDAVPGSTPPDTRVLAEHASRALPEIIRDINKLSDNTLARALFLSMGSLEPDLMAGSRPLPPDGSDTRLRADAAVRQWLHEHGIDDSGLVLENGSGLSRIERMTAAQMAAVLQAGQRSQWAPEFISSLPIVALDGTMRRRLKDSPAATRARLKTGTLNGVTALAGYVPDAKGELCIFAGFINHEAAGNGHGRAVLDALVDWVARSGGN